MKLDEWCLLLFIASMTIKLIEIVIKELFL